MVQASQLKGCNTHSHESLQQLRDNLDRPSQLVCRLGLGLLEHTLHENLQIGKELKDDPMGFTETRYEPPVKPCITTTIGTSSGVELSLAGGVESIPLSSGKSGSVQCSREARHTVYHHPLDGAMS